MPRLSWLSAVLFILLVSFVQPAQAAEEACQSQLYLGAAPVLKNPKLSEHTFRVCFSESPCSIPAWPGPRCGPPSA